MRWAGLMIVAVAGCAEVSIPGLGSSRPLGELSAPLDTSFPEGIYLGEITCRTRSWGNGELLQDDTETRSYHEVVDSNGLPLLQPGGETPVEGLVVHNNIPPIDTTRTITSMRAFGDRLVIEYLLTFIFTLMGETVTVSGLGSMTYEFVPPGTLSYIDNFDGASNVSATGDFLRQSIDCSSTLDR